VMLKDFTVQFAAYVYLNMLKSLETVFFKVLRNDYYLHINTSHLINQA